ncbi:MAG: S-methyl-5-thioribose-phosphate isomerase [Pseudomonadota bacterium]|jgi:methylthioribose-1-phosphate isomerase
MKVNGRHFRSIWFDPADGSVNIIDQTRLPHEFVIRKLHTVADAVAAIRDMQVRGAPLIGVTAVFGLYLALRQSPGCLHQASNDLLATRPTAVNLAWALARAEGNLSALPTAVQIQAALDLAQDLADEDVKTCQAIGEQGVGLLEQLWRAKADHSAPLNVLTHCNAGWLATVDWGTALSVVYRAQAEGIPLHVWVDETRPRNQGAALTTWELGQQGIDHSLVADNTGGLLMQQGEVDVVLVGSDRTTAGGDVCNKIGTYLKALAARDNGVPFYVALPVSSIDFGLQQGSDVPIEQRSPSEVTHITGRDPQGVMQTVQLAPDGTRAVNYGFDITPARLVTALITERGVCPPEPEAIAVLRAT